MNDPQETSVEYDNDSEIEETLIASDEGVELDSEAVEIIQETKSVPLAACDVRRKIEDILDQKRYREQEGNELSFDEF